MSTKNAWVLVRQENMADRVVSVHATKEAAENAMRKKGGIPDSLFRNGMTILNAGPDGSYELLRLDGRYIVRPDLEKRRRNAHAAMRQE